MNIILMYHRVAAPLVDPYQLAIHPARFAEHVAELRRTGGVVPLDEVLQAGTVPRVAITFDDGYADNATLAAPMLARAGLPATWFITSRRLGQRRFWWDRLADGLLGGHPMPDSMDVEVAGRDLWIDLRTPAARLTALRFLHRRLRALPPDILEPSVERVLQCLGAPSRPDADDRTMTVEQLRVLADLPGQDVGAHTCTHLQLRDQAEVLQRAEVLGSVADLSAVLKRPVRHFAYPFGSGSAVGSLAPRLVAEAGCSLAVTTDPGPVRRRGNRYLLPRLTVGNLHGEEFRAMLRAAMASG